jgi:hypothetical protein
MPKQKDVSKYNYINQLFSVVAPQFTCPCARLQIMRCLYGSKSVDLTV